MKQLKTENELVKANNGRLQDEVIAKSRKIEELLNPDLQSNDLRRTLTSKKPDASEVVMSLRRKVYKAEENLRDKENVIRYLSLVNSFLWVTILTRPRRGFWTALVDSFTSLCINHLGLY